MLTDPLIAFLIGLQIGQWVAIWGLIRLGKIKLTATQDRGEPELTLSRVNAKLPCEITVDSTKAKKRKGE